ncbi:MAG TPA: Ig-like domain-containing protein, partial [Vicinamibacterales bacterium]|nr:Ig-like domain-containing protein [Vicinamibacterales bacterium]
MHSRFCLGTLVLGVVLGAAACKDSPSGPGTRTPTTVVVSSPQTVMIVGSSIQLAAIVYDQNQSPIAGAQVQWESLTPQVASVTPDGVVTGVAIGTATIRATIGVIAGDVELTVDPDPCVTPIVLNVGQVRILSGPAAVACITLGATTTATDFLFVTANATQQLDNLGLYQVAVPVATSQSALASALGLQALDPQLAAEQQAVAYSDDLEAAVRRQEFDLMRRVAPAVRARAAQAGPAGGAALALAVAAEGDTVTYRVPDVRASNLCTTYTDVRAVVKRLTPHATIVQDVNAPSGGFSDADFTAIGQEFENVIYRTDTLFFGRETDRNADGRITILYTPEVNRATASGALGFIAGFFWGGDLVRRTEYQQQGIECPQTNEQEMFYLLVPDPNGTINSNPRSVSMVRVTTLGTITHEFQHMINQGIRLFDPAVQAAETPWLNEALSHMAEELVGRAKRGFADFQDLTFADVNPDPNQPDVYNSYFRQNLVRFRDWMFRPDTSSPISAKARDQIAPRGAGWMFLRYVTDHFSGGNARSFLRQVVAGPDVGLANVLQHAAGGQFDDMLSGFLVSQYADGLNVANLQPRYTVRSWDVRSVMTGASSNVFPLLVRPLPATISTQSLSGSGNYFRLTSATASPET